MSVVTQDLWVPAAKDGFPIAATIFENAEASSEAPVVFVCSATGVLRAFYRKFALFLAQNGCAAVITFDYRGVGDSLHDKSSIDKLPRAKNYHVKQEDRIALLQKLHDCSISDHWAARDTEGILLYLLTGFPDRAVVHVGHSVGGHILGFMPSRGKVSQSLFSSVNNAYYGWSPRPYITYFGVKCAAPILTSLLGYFPSSKLGLGEDIPAAAGRQWMYWCLTSKYMTIDKDVEKLFLSYKETHLIAIGFSDDHLATFNSFHSMAKRIYGNLPSEVYFFDAKVPIGHFGFFYRNDTTLPLWNWLLPWILKGKPLQNAPYPHRTPSRL